MIQDFADDIFFIEKKKRKSQLEILQELAEPLGWHVDKDGKEYCAYHDDDHSAEYIFSTIKETRDYILTQKESANV